MSVSTSNRQASVNEIVAEMDRRGVVIERLEARIVELESQLRDAQARGKGMEETLRKLTFAARTSGGTAGRDEELCKACDAAEAVLSRIEGSAST